MSFLKISNANIAFNKKTFTWKFYTINEALPTTEQVQLVDPKEFVIAASDVDSKTFVMHVVIREREEMLVHTEKQAQVRALIFNEASTEIPLEYSNYSDV